MNIPKAKKIQSGNYRIQIQLDGKRHSITRPTQKECRREAEMLKAAFLTGQMNGKSGMTFGEALEQYISSRENILSPSTHRHYCTIKRTHFIAEQKMPMREIDWQKAVNREAKKYAFATLKPVVALIRCVYAANSVPAPLIRLPDPPPKEHAFLTFEQIKTFLTAVRGTDVELPALLALHSLRVSEIYALKAIAGKIEVRGSVVYGPNGFVEKPTNKNATSTRNIPIFIPRLAEIKDQLPVTMSQPILRRRLSDIYRAAGLPQVGIHGLRHSFCSLCYHVGLNEQVTMELGGWANDVVMKKIYRHLAEKDKEAAVQKLKDFFAEA